MDYGTVDFVVIGSGSAGSVAAARLSEIGQWRVLLLEAGQEETDFTRIPSMFLHAAKAEHNWGFRTAPQNTCSLSTGGTYEYARGKSLGGSSAINYLLYSRGNRLDYDNWEAQGNPGWSYEDVLPYFIKSEYAFFSGQEGYHGYWGPLNVEHYHPSSKKLDIFLQANREIGIPIVDYNGERQLGASKAQLNTRRGSRLSSARAFLRPAAHRANLKILTNSYVTKILISSETKQAYGVLFSRRNIQYVVRVHKEVVLCGGVFGSAQLLMLSGVGPSGHLEQLGIPVMKNLEVGKNLHDHLALSETYIYTHITEPYFSLRDAVRQYLNGSGPLTIAANSQGIGYYKVGSKTSDSPDIEIVFDPSINYDGFISPDNPKDIFKNNIIRMFIFLMHPKTRGSVYLKSSDPYEFPVIDSKCLADPLNEDMETLLEGFKIIMRLLNTASFKKLSPVLLPYPMCSKHHFLSRDYLTCLIRQTAYNALHGSGTCKMGPDPSNGAVVGYNFKVHGIRNLRVADASVIPSPLTAHTSAPCMMIGERVADFIKLDYNAL